VSERLIRLRPYLIALTLLWVLPALALPIAIKTLPDTVPDGQCSGIGFGCTLSPADELHLATLVLVGPALFILGLVTVFAIWFRRWSRQRRKNHFRV
jgi:hypothetical protein